MKNNTAAPAAVAVKICRRTTVERVKYFYAIIFTRHAASADLWKVSVDGGEITPLTFDKGLSFSDGFSPDGDKIVFAVGRRLEVSTELRETLISPF